MRTVSLKLETALIIAVVVVIVLSVVGGLAMTASAGTAGPRTTGAPAEPGGTWSPAFNRLDLTGSAAAAERAHFTRVACWATGRLGEGGEVATVSRTRS